MSASVWTPGTSITPYDENGVPIEDVVTATAGQTVFPLPNATFVTGLSRAFVSKNGFWLPPQDYTLTAPNVITLASPCFAEDQLLVISFRMTLVGTDAENVVYTASGTGTVARTQADRNEDVFSIFEVLTEAQRANVRNFSNVADLSTAFATAKTRVAAAGGGRIWLPPGLYPLGADVGVDADGVEFVGSGRQAAQILVTALNSKAFNITGSRCALRGLQISYAGTPVSGATAVRVFGSFCHFTDFLIASSYVGIEVDSAVSTKITDFDIRAYKQAGIYCHDMNDVFIDDFVMDALTSANGSLGGLRLYNKCEAVVVSNGDIIRGQYGLSTDAASYTARQRPGACKFSQVYFDSSLLNGIRLDKAVEFDFQGCWISFAGYNDSAASVAANGVELVQVDGVRFTSGQVVNCHGHGVGVTASAKRVVFSGGFTARENSLLTANTHSGISVAANTNDFLVKGCILGGADTAFSAGTQEYGIEVAVGTSDRYVIADNLVSGNGTAGVSDGGTGVNKRVADNY